MKRSTSSVSARGMLAAIVASLTLCGITAAAAEYPDKPVRLIVPFAPGGVADLAARLVSQGLSLKWRQQVVVENRPGAGGLLGVEAVIRAEPDGYTILMATNGEVVIHQAIAKTVRFDALQDLAPIAMTTSTPFVWSANANSGIGSLADLVTKAKVKPGGLAYSSAGLGSSNHLATEQFAVATGIKLLHVPYRGGAPAVAAISAGDVPVGVAALSSAKPLADSGRAQLLAVTVSKRVRLLPDVPTVAETGVLSAFESSIWTGVFAPRGTPSTIIAKLEADVIEVLKNAAFDNRLQAVGADILGASGSEMATRIKAEIEDMAKTAKEAGIALTD